MFILFFAFCFFSSLEASSSFECKIEFDKLNIPHVETSSIDEFYYCFGLSHGRDRAWEMDYFRRVGQGRNAEVQGFSQLKSDLMMRLLDLPELANSIWKNFSGDNRRFLEFYAQGVNAGFKKGKDSQEFKDLDYVPEPWLPEHSILVMVLQSFDQTRKTFYRDYEEEKIKYLWKEKAADLFNEDGMPWESNILKDGEYEKKVTTVKVSPHIPKELKLWESIPTLFGEETGSNNWAISKKKSKNGKAMFANDPHLDLRTPLFWYWINLKSRGYKVVGGSVPGVPVVVSGTNGKVAWGLTNSYLKSADAFLVKDLKDGDTISLRPLVMVKFWFFKIPFFFKSFERLKSGHRVLPLEVESEDKLVLRWTGFTMKPEDFYPMFNLFKMKDVTELDSLLSSVGIPSWNFIFADSKGDIGFRLIGKTIKQLHKTPLGIRQIKASELESYELLGPSERPHALKPKKDYVYSANNRHWPSDSKFYGGRAYSQSYRGFRLDEMLAGMHDLESFKNIQCDTQVVDARFFLPKFKKYLKMAEFNNWSMVAEDSSVVLPLYRRFFDLLIEKWELNEYALFKVLDDLDLKQQQDMMAIYELAKSEVKGRTWGEIHRVKFPHLSKNENWKFSPDIAGVGDTHSINPGTAFWNKDLGVYEQNSGASMRMIVELGDTPRVLLSLPGRNRFYDKKKSDSPWDSWKQCQYTEIKF